MGLLGLSSAESRRAARDIGVGRIDPLRIRNVHSGTAKQIAKEWRWWNGRCRRGVSAPYTLQAAIAGFISEAANTAATDLAADCRALQRACARRTVARRRIESPVAVAMRVIRGRAV